MCAKRSENQCIALRSPLNGSLTWWLCLTSKQTVIHMSVLWPRFHLEQFHRGHWKQKSSRVKDLNPSPASAHQPLPHILCRPLSKGRFIYVGSTSVVFLYLFPPLWLERRVTAKNSHQLACHFPVVLCLTRGFGETSERLLVSVVKTPFQFIFEKYSKYLFSRASWLLTGIRPVPYALKCDVRCG